LSLYPPVQTCVILICSALKDILYTITAHYCLAQGRSRPENHHKKLDAVVIQLAHEESRLVWLSTSMASMVTSVTIVNIKAISQLLAC